MRWEVESTPLGGSFVVTQIRQVDEDTTPLEAREIDHVLACYRELKARRPELAQAEIIVNVANELAWSKRNGGAGAVLSRDGGQRDRAGPGHRCA